MTDQAPSVDEMAVQLQHAGWTQKAPHIWRAPNGSLFLGPVGAWRRMRRLAPFQRADDARDLIVARAVKLRIEIAEFFADAAHWNDEVRDPDQAAIDVDPDGKLTRMAAGLDKALAAEDSRT